MISAIASQIYQAAKKAATGEWVWRAEWSKAMKKAQKILAVNKLEEKKSILLDEVQELVSIKNRKFSEIDIESPMTSDEKQLTSKISSIWAEINNIVKKIRNT